MGYIFFLVSPQPARLIFDSHLLLDEASEFDRAEVGVPYAVIYLFKPNVLTGTLYTDIYPVTLPAHSAIVADIAPVEVSGILQ